MIMEDNVPDLVAIQLMPGVMTDNLEMSLAQEGRKPWAFPSFLSSMNGIRPGVNVMFIRTTMPGGEGVGRKGAYPPEAIVHRIVIGSIVAPVVENASPFFPGFPHEFWFDLIEDIAVEPPVDLATASGVLNGKLPGLGIDKEKLLTLLSNGRSAKVGMFFDGEPRLAEYFKNIVPITAKPATAPAAKAPAPTPISATASSLPVLAAVDDFVAAVKASGLIFGGINEDLPRAFLAALMAKPFVLLTGLSGSGKTQLARAFGQWLGSDSDGPRHLVVPVRADWTTPEPLLGYEDALLPLDGSGSRAWAVPTTLEFILRADRSPQRLFVLILDEMNLAHVERYFADVLSGMESGEAVLPNLTRGSGSYWYPASGGPTLIPLPQNLFVIGTVNVDETTYQFSPKVLDRSFSFEFRVATDELNGSLRRLVPVADSEPRHVSAVGAISADPDWHIANPSTAQPEIETLLSGLHSQLAPIGLEFGHRSYREALRMAAILSASGVTSYEDIADWVVMTKMLPRVHGSRRQLEPFLRSLQSTALGAEPEKPELPRVARKTARMLSSLLTNQYAGFAE
jgi:5-methylcytosine-specific restriction protein B